MVTVSLLFYGVAVISVTVLNKMIDNITYSKILCLTILKQMYEINLIMYRKIFRALRSGYLSVYISSISNSSLIATINISCTFYMIKKYGIQSARGVLLNLSQTRVLIFLVFYLLLTIHVPLQC